MSLKAVRRRSFAGAMAVLALGASVLGNMAISAPEAKAEAATSGPGYMVRDTSASSSSAYHWAGAFEGPDGNLAWCVEAGKVSSRPTAPYGSISNTRLSAALNLYEGVNTADSRAALALLVHEKEDIGPEWSQWVNDVSNAPPAVRELADTYWANTAPFNGPYSIEGDDPVTTDNGRTYTFGHISIRAAEGNYVYGYGKINVTIPDNSPAVFDDGSKSKDIDSGDSVTIKATGFGTAQLQYTARDIPGSLNTLLLYREAPNLQTMLTAVSPADILGNSATVNVSVAFQPTIKSKVASEFITEGSAPVDNLTIGLDKTVSDSWMDSNGKPIEATFKGTLYGPYDTPQDPSQVAPENAPVVATATVTADKVGDVQSGADVKVSKSGYYTWVWELKKADQSPDGQKYIDHDFNDGFFTEGETSIVKMKPTITTVADNQTVKPGDPMIDKVTLSLTDGGKWITNKDGSKLSIPANGTLYGPFNQPLEQSDEIPADAPVAGHENIVFDEAGTKSTTGNVRAAGPGFYTWVWKIDDSNYYEGYQTPFMEFAESSVVKHVIRHESKTREYTLLPTSHSFDHITVSSLPEDHGDFKGTTSGWKGDLNTAHVTVYGPMEAEPTTAEIPANAPVLKRFDIEAKNGTYPIGYDDATKVTIPDDGYGYYVFVYSFDGDDRVEAFHSAFNDKYEQFYVPAPPAPKLNVTTKATPTVKHGEKARDTALVSGTLPKSGANLSFKAYRAEKDAEGKAVCKADNQVFETNYGKINSTGSFESEETTFDRPGDYYWVETVTDDSGAVLHKGDCGLPNETTTVIEENKPAQATTFLAHTGADILPFVGAGVVLIGVAAGVIVARRRRHAEEVASE